MILPIKGSLHGQRPACAFFGWPISESAEGWQPRAEAHGAWTSNSKA